MYHVSCARVGSCMMYRVPCIMYHASCITPCIITRYELYNTTRYKLYTMIHDHTHHTLPALRHHTLVHTAVVLCYEMSHHVLRDEHPTWRERRRQRPHQVSVHAPSRQKHSFLQMPLVSFLQMPLVLLGCRKRVAAPASSCLVLHFADWRLLGTTTTTSGIANSVLVPRQPNAVVTRALHMCKRVHTSNALVTRALHMWTRLHDMQRACDASGNVARGAVQEMAAQVALRLLLLPRLHFTALGLLVLLRVHLTPCLVVPRLYFPPCLVEGNIECAHPSFQDPRYECQGNIMRACRAPNCV